MKALIIGAGFYGISIALLLKDLGIETEIVDEASTICSRATSVNQARVHNGYHYPRNYLTALRSHENYARFTVDYGYAIHSKFEHIYAISRNNSKINGPYFKVFMNKIGSPLTEVQVRGDLFNSHLVESVFTVDECVFDSEQLAKRLAMHLKKKKINIHFNTPITSLNESRKFSKADIVVNTTYSRINSFLYNSNLPLLPLKHEVTEIALIKPPKEFEKKGITVMDGLFFSMLPFPSFNCHSLTHVRFTPHYSWIDRDEYKDPYEVLNNFDKVSKYGFMIADAVRYIPQLAKTRYLKSLWEIKTVLLENENDDGRPILYRKDYAGIQNLFLVMGGKIDNIYDILRIIKSEGRFKECH
ncbi:MAG: FAD-dependent oxidoreductase [Patescibacteria group bacterium]